MKLALPSGLVLALSLIASPITLPHSSFADDSLQYAQKLSEAFENAAKIITPSVVNISASKKAKSSPTRKMSRRDPFFDQFRDFFGDDFMERFQQPLPDDDSPGQQGLGTGVIVDADKGYILTNNHVVGEADTLEVRLPDGKKVKAELVGKDERSDLAVIKVKATGLVAAKLGDSDKLKIGEWVVAAGNPFGLDNTITAGIVSAKGRSIMGGGQYEDFIQTDAAINPGNSGGPLVNLEGEVVGINTAIFSRSGGYMGIGFAIPATMARNVLESLVSSGKVVRGWLGVGIQNLTEDLAKSFNYDGTEGALVGHVEEDGPGAKAGLKQGDIIVGLNGEPLREINQLRNRIANLKPGSSVALDVLRDSKHQTINVKVGELPANLGKDKASPEDSDDSDDNGNTSFGIAVEDLTPQLARKIGTQRHTGAVIVGLKPGSIAARAGIAPMDIVISVNGAAVRSASELKAALKRANISQGLRLVVESQGMERFVFLRDQ